MFKNPPSPAVAAARARVAGLSNGANTNLSALEEARRELSIAKLQDHIGRVAVEGPLTADQFRCLAAELEKCSA